VTFLSDFFSPGVCGSRKTPLYLHPLFEGTLGFFRGVFREEEKFIDILTNSVAPFLDEGEHVQE
jgi:hypothetical protein